MLWQATPTFEPPFTIKRALKLTIVLTQEGKYPSIIANEDFMGEAL
jgi:hypothetical protein